MYENHANHEAAGQKVDRDDSTQDSPDLIPDSGTERLRSRIARPADGRSLDEVAADLDGLRPVPGESLLLSVAMRGACMDPLPDGDPPGWLFDAATDRELAARLCAGCPVQRECLELELRLYGPTTVGVWGALGEDDRRALYPLWAARRDGTDPADDARDESVGGER